MDCLYLYMEVLTYRKKTSEEVHNLPVTAIATAEDLNSCHDFARAIGGGTSEQSCRHEFLCRQPVSILSDIQVEVNVIHKLDCH